MNRLASSPCPSPRARASVVVRRGARLASVVAGCFAMSLLAGADGCTITIEPIEECVELDDVCPNLECEVYATNDDGCAICECAPVPPSDDVCYTDDDCAPGEVCVYTVNALPEEKPDDGNSNSEERALVAPAGTCEPITCPAVAPAPPACGDDEEIICERDPSDPCNAWCYCQPIPGPCDDDVGALCDMIPPECEDGLVLAVQNGCYSCVDAETCEPPPPPLGCEAVLCAPDTECVETPDGPQCVPVEEGCYSDADCEDGAYCNASDVCLPPPGCDDPAAGCLAVCYGECVRPDDAAQ